MYLNKAVTKTNKQTQNSSPVQVVVFQGPQSEEFSMLKLRLVDFDDP